MLGGRTKEKPEVSNVICKNMFQGEPSVLILHLHNSHTFPEALGTRFQNQDLLQGMDCMFLEVVKQTKWLMLSRRQGMLQ